MSAIRIGGAQTANVVEHREDGVVSCTELRSFWVNWENGRIRVGKGGDMGQLTFMEVNDTEFVGVNFLAVSAGWGSDAVWVFNDDLGK